MKRNLQYASDVDGWVADFSDVLQVERLILLMSAVLPVPCCRLRGFVLAGVMDSGGLETFTNVGIAVG